MPGALPRTHTYAQGVRVLLDGNGELFRFGTHSLPPVGALLYWSPLAGSPVVYRVTNVGYVIEEQESIPDYSSYAAVTVVVA